MQTLGGDLSLVCLAERSSQQGETNWRGSNLIGHLPQACSLDVMAAADDKQGVEWLMRA